MMTDPTVPRCSQVPGGAVGSRPMATALHLRPAGGQSGGAGVADLRGLRGLGWPHHRAEWSTQGLRPADASGGPWVAATLQKC